jgi:E3 ubiquitin-protein ligase HUWE1
MNQLLKLIAKICEPIPLLVKSIAEKKQNIKPPEIPNVFIQRLMVLIAAPQCPRNIFKHALNLISHVACLDGVLEYMTEYLISTAMLRYQLIKTELEKMSRAVKSYKFGDELDRSIISLFSYTNSNQAGLLRVLETIEYLYTCKLNPSSQTLNKNKKLLLNIYQQLDFEAMWKELGECLSLLQQKQELSQMTSIFLPLIDVLTKVSRYSLSNKGKIEAKPINAQGQTFIKFMEDHKDVVNSFVRENPALLNGSFSILLRLPRLVDFKNKRRFFYRKLYEHRKPTDPNYILGMHIRRDYVFEDSFNELRIADNEIKDTQFEIMFEGEEGVDAGGLTREWLTILSKDIFDANNALFVVSAADKLTYQPNRASNVNSEHLRYFKFIGLVIAKAIYDKMVMDVHFTRSFYKHILKKPVDYRDVEALDPTYFKSLVWMLENDITDIIDLTFSIDRTDFGEAKVIELKENGSNIPVTEENKQEFVALVANQKLLLDIKEQIEHFLQGFYYIIPANLVAIFDEQELELLIAGLPDIEIDDWIANTVYVGYKLNSPQIKWFWRAVRSFSTEDRVKLLQFATGTARVPIDGFSQLQGSNGVQKFQIHKDFGDVKRLPSAHTW